MHRPMLGSSPLALLRTFAAEPKGDAANAFADSNLVETPSQPKVVDLFAWLPRLARFSAPHDRLRAAAEALTLNGHAGVHILIYGRRAASMHVRAGDVPFTFEPELVSRGRRAFVDVLRSYMVDGVARIAAEDFAMLADFGRPPNILGEGIVVIPITATERDLGCIVLGVSGLGDAPDSLRSLRLWVDVFSTMIEHDLRVSRAEELDSFMRALRDVRDANRILGVAVETIGIELGVSAEAVQLRGTGLDLIAVSPFGRPLGEIDRARILENTDEIAEFKGAIGVPILTEGRFWGAIIVEEAAPDQDIRNFVRSVASQTSLAIGNAMAFARQRRFALESAALSDVGRTLLGHTRLQPLTAAMIRLATEVASADFAAVFLPDHAGGYTCEAASAGAERCIDLVQPLLSLVNESGETQTSHDDRVVVIPMNEVGTIMERSPQRSCLAVVRSPHEPAFSREMFRLLDAFSTLCALALRNVRLYEESGAAILALGESNAFKDDLLAMFTHDFKGPLTVISGRGELALEHLVGEEREHVSIILTQVKRLAKLADDALALAKAQTAGFVLHPEPGELLSFVSEMCASSFLSARERVAIEARQSTLPLEFDPSALRHILENIIGNALKYSTDVVRIEIFSERGEAVVIVRDRGIGIPAAELAGVFGRFVRGSNARHRGIHGSGVGLYLARRLTEQHGGRIFASSCEGEGSTFEVRLPLP